MATVNTEIPAQTQKQQPGREQVMSWFAGQELALVEEAVSDHDGWSYRHFLLRR